MKLYVQCCKSKDKDTLYYTLKCDFGYRVGILTMEKSDICEIADITLATLYNMKADEIIEVGQILKKVK